MFGQEKSKGDTPPPRRDYMATVSEILPEFDPATLTLKVRLEVDNPKFALRPGMFMDVEFPITCLLRSTCRLTPSWIQGSRRPIR